MPMAQRGTTSILQCSAGVNMRTQSISWTQPETLGRLLPTVTFISHGKSPLRRPTAPHHQDTMGVDQTSAKLYLIYIIVFSRTTPTHMLWHFHYIYGVTNIDRKVLRSSFERTLTCISKVHDNFVFRRVQIHCNYWGVIILQVAPLPLPTSSIRPRRIRVSLLLRHHPRSRTSSKA